MLLNCGVGEDSCESLGLQGDPTSHWFSKGNQSWMFIGRTDTEAPILWPPDGKNWLTGKDPDAGKIEGRRWRGQGGWDGWMASPTRWTWVWVNPGSWWWSQGSLACCSPWGRKESDTTEQLKWTDIHQQRKSHTLGFKAESWLKSYWKENERQVMKLAF